MAKLSQPYAGPLSHDITALAPILVDLAPGSLRGLRAEQPGLHEVLAELTKSLPIFGDAAGVGPQLHQELTTCNDNLARIRAAQSVVAKWREVLDESYAYYAHEREVVIGQVADAVKSSARRKDTSLLAPFEKTVAYNSQVGLRAAKTRKKNADAAIADGASEE
ncbi:hypothetical protein [Chondromyces crocatus]|nr:hypothetical protein [Chondromyces crocatus]